MKKDQDIIFKNLSSEIKRINKYATPIFYEDLKNRNKAINLPSDTAELFELITKIVFYSQNARSSLVDKLLFDKKVGKIFFNYDVKKCSILNPCDIVENNWTLLKPIRQKTKIFQLILIARILNKQNLLDYLKSLELPTTISKEDDIEDFWKKLLILKKYFIQLSFPFFSSTTSILHLLLEFGYPAIKPDSSVQKALNVLSNKNLFKIGMQTDKEISKILYYLQLFTLSSDLKLKPNQLDLYLMTIGKQTSIVDNGYIDEKYYKW